MFDFNFAPEQNQFPAIAMTHIPEIAKPAPTEGPYDWASGTFGADSFVFRVDMERDVTCAEFA